MVSSYYTEHHRHRTFPSSQKFLVGNAAVDNKKLPLNRKLEKNTIRSSEFSEQLAAMGRMN